MLFLRVWDDPRKPTYGRKDDPVFEIPRRVPPESRAVARKVGDRQTVASQRRNGRLSASRVLPILLHRKNELVLHSRHRNLIIIGPPASVGSNLLRKRGSIRAVPEGRIIAR